MNRLILLPIRGETVTPVGVTARHEIRAQPGAGLLASPRCRTLVVGLLLATATLALYYPVHGHPFANYDDSLYVTENDQVQVGLTWLTVKWAFTTFEVAPLASSHLALARAWIPNCSAPIPADRMTPACCCIR